MRSFRDNTLKSLAISCSQEGIKMQENLKIALDGRTLTARLSGELDHHTAASIRERLDTELFKVRPEVLVMDFSGVEFMDSSGIGLIIGRSEVARATHAVIRISGMSERLLKLLRMSGISKLDNVTLG
jgi:stage II sporulation protein AA (anti-sigma F factor antagonist)